MGAADRDRKHTRGAPASTLVGQRSGLVERSWDWNVGDRDAVVNLVRDEFGADWIGGALSLEGYAAEATLRHLRTSLDNICLSPQRVRKENENAFQRAQNIPKTATAYQARLTRRIEIPIN